MVNRVLRYLIEKISEKTGIPCVAIITMIMAAVAAHGYFNMQLGWITLVYLPVWIFVVYVYWDDQSHMRGK